MNIAKRIGGGFLLGSLLLASLAQGHLCGSPTDEVPLKVSRQAAWAKSHKILLKAELTIGTDDIENEEYVFGVIRDIEIDEQGQIYILDGKNYRIRKYSREGEYLSTIGKGYGQGPGEFQRPMRFALGPDKTLYVLDVYRHEVLIFGREGDYIDGVPIKGFGADIVAGPSGDFYITKLFNSGEYAIDMYDIQTKKLKTEFCPNRPAEYSRGGNSSRLAVDPGGNVLCSLFYPYEILEFSSEGKGGSSFSRQANFQAPYRNEVGSWDAPSVSFALARFPDGKLLNGIRRITGKSPGRQISCEFDIFGPDGQWLINFPQTMLDVKRVMVINVDSQGKLYVDDLEPYPHIIRFSMEFIRR